MGLILNGYYNVITWKKGSSEKHIPKHILQLDVDTDDDYLLFLKFANHSDIPNIDLLKKSLEVILSKNDKTLIILTPRKEPPLLTASEDEYVFSFCCNLTIFNKAFNSMKGNTIASTELLFLLLDKNTCGSSLFEAVLVKQLPFYLKQLISINGCDVIIPHKGKAAYLKNVLHYLNNIEGTVGYVGIDQMMDKGIFKIIAKKPEISFYNFSPNPVGPYVIRNTLIDQGENDLIFFQDSDDFPCADRFEMISDYMYNNGCESCGSHELRMDYYTKTIIAVRFPIDVTASLRQAPWFALLHPTSAIYRKKFYECNRLSQERIFGNDTKFLLYSYFILRSIKNIDEFLYIRKRHPNSLTTSPETMLGSKIRRDLLRTWNTDFELVKAGELNLEDSSLCFKDCAAPFNFRKI